MEILLSCDQSLVCIVTTIKNGTTSKEGLDSARQLWLSIICNTGEKN